MFDMLDCPFRCFCFVLVKKNQFNDLCMRVHALSSVWGMSYIPMWMSCTRNDCFLLRVHTPNKFIYCSCKVHNNYAIMNLTVIPYIVIIFVCFFSFLRDPMLIFFFLRGVIFIFMFHNLRGLFGTASHHNLCISVNVMRHQMQFLTFIC